MVKYLIILFVGFVGTAQASTDQERHELMRITFCDIFASDEFFAAVDEYDSSESREDRAIRLDAMANKSVWFENEGVTLLHRMLDDPEDEGRGRAYLRYTRNIVDYYRKLLDEPAWAETIDTLRTVECDIMYNNR